MCTVTFIPVRSSVFITSNRDEKLVRPAASTPSPYIYNDCRMIGPRDTAAGGSWIAYRENGDAAVLLNGAFVKHISQPPYRRSRGLVFLDILSHDRPSFFFSKNDLAGIEPFTLILFEKKCLYQFRWDGHEKYAKQLSASRPHIWSSATLYDSTIIRKREEWFAGFLNRTISPTQQDILNFHRFSGDGDAGNDLLMSRDNLYSTVSITGIHLTEDRASIKHIELPANKLSEVKTSLINPVPAT